MEQLSIVLVGMVLLIALYAILASFFTVRTAEVAVVTRFGKFQRVAEAGLNWKTPFVERVAGLVSLRVNQITLTMETKTKDNVFVTIPISVQNRVRPEKVYDAYYQPVRSRRPDQVLCRAGDPRACARHDARRGVRLAVEHRPRRQTGTGCRHVGIRLRDRQCAGDRHCSRLQR